MKVCPSHSGFDANYTVYYVDDDRIDCEGLNDCNGNGDCLAGKCFCHTGYSEAHAIPNVMLEIPTALKMTKHRGRFPRPRMGHAAASTFSESYTNVAIEHIHGLLVSSNCNSQITICPK